MATLLSCWSSCLRASAAALCTPVPSPLSVRPLANPCSPGLDCPIASQVRVLPCVVMFVGGVAAARITGFEELGGKDDFPTSKASGWGVSGSLCSWWLPFHVDLGGKENFPTSDKK